MRMRRLSFCSGDCFVFISKCVLQELNSRLETAAQENKDVRNRLLSLEETVSFSGNERQVLQDKVNVFTEERAAVEKEMASLRESVETLEAEKQVCCSLFFL